MMRQDFTPFGAVSFQGKHATLTFRTRLAHPPEAVWDAITDPKQLSLWYMTRAAIDGRKGGSIDFRTGAGQLHATGRILAWEPPHLFEYEWKVKPRPEMPEGENTIVRWELRREGSETVLTLTHRNLSRTKALGAAPFTHAVLERLAAQLDGRPFQDFGPQVAEIQAQYAARDAKTGTGSS